MRTLSVKDFKAQFSAVTKLVKEGEEIIVTYGKQKQIIGVFKRINIEKPATRKIGIYNNMPGYLMADDFNETTQKEFPN